MAPDPLDRLKNALGRHVEPNLGMTLAEAVERMEVAIARTQAAGQPFWVEYERVLDHLRRHGRLRWEEFSQLDARPR